MMAMVTGLGWWVLLSAPVLVWAGLQRRWLIACAAALVLGMPLVWTWIVPLPLWFRADPAFAGGYAAGFVQGISPYWMVLTLLVSAGALIRAIVQRHSVWAGLIVAVGAIAAVLQVWWPLTILVWPWMS